MPSVQFQSISICTTKKLEKILKEWEEIDEWKPGEKATTYESDNKRSFRSESEHKRFLSLQNLKQKISELTTNYYSLQFLHFKTLHKTFERQPSILHGETEIEADINNRESRSGIGKESITRVIPKNQHAQDIQSNREARNSSEESEYIDNHANFSGEQHKGQKAQSSDKKATIPDNSLVFHDVHDFRWEVAFDDIFLYHTGQETSSTLYLERDASKVDDSNSTKKHKSTIPSKSLPKQVHFTILELNSHGEEYIFEDEYILGSDLLKMAVRGGKMTISMMEGLLSVNMRINFIENNRLKKISSAIDYSIQDESTSREDTQFQSLIKEFEKLQNERSSLKDDFELGIAHSHSLEINFDNSSAGRTTHEVSKMSPMPSEIFAPMYKLTKDSWNNFTQQDQGNLPFNLIHQSTQRDHFTDRLEDALIFNEFLKETDNHRNSSHENEVVEKKLAKIKQMLSPISSPRSMDLMNANEAMVSSIKFQRNDKSKSNLDEEMELLIREEEITNLYTPLTRIIPSSSHINTITSSSEISPRCDGNLSPAARLLNAITKRQASIQGNIIHSNFNDSPTSNNFLTNSQINHESESETQIVQSSSNIAAIPNKKDEEPTCSESEASIKELEQQSNQQDVKFDKQDTQNEIQSKHSETSSSTPLQMKMKESEAEKSLWIQLHELKQIVIQQKEVISNQEEKIKKLNASYEKALLALKALKFRSDKSDQMCEAYLKEKESLLSQIVELRETIGLLRQELLTTEENGKEINECYERLTESQSQLQKEKEHFEYNYNAASQEIDSLHSKIQATTSKVTTLLEEVSHLKEKLATAKSCILRLQNEKTALVERINVVESQRNDALNTIEDRDRSIAEQKEEIQALHMKLDVIQKANVRTMEQSDMKFESIRSKYIELEDEHNKTKDLLTSELHKLQEDCLRSTSELERVRAENEVLKGNWDDTCSPSSIETYILSVRSNFLTLQEEERKKYDLERSELKNKLTQFQKQAKDFETTIDQLQNTISHKDDEISEFKNLISTLTRKNEELRKAQSEIKDQHRNKSNSNPELLDSRINEYNVERNFLHERLKQADYEKKVANNSLKEAVVENSILHQKIDHLNENLNELQMQNEDLRYKMNSKQQLYNESLEKEREIFKGRISRLDNRIKELQDEIKRHVATQGNLEAKLENERQIHLQNLDKQRLVSSEKEKDISEYADKLFLAESSLQKELQNLTLENKVIKNDLKLLQESYQIQQHEKDELQQKIDSMKGELQAQKLATLDGEFSSTYSKKQIQEKEHEIAHLQQSLKSLKDQQKGEKDSIMRELKQHGETVEILNSKLEQKQKTIETLELELKKSNELANIAKENTSRLNLEASISKNLVSKLENESQLNEKYMKSKIEDLQMIIARKEIELESIKERNLMLESEVECLNYDIQRLKASLNDSTTESSLSKQQIEALKRISAKEKAVAFNAINSLRETNISLHKEIRDLQEKFNLLCNDKVFNTLEKERLKDELQYVEKKFKVAIENFNNQNIRLNQEIRNSMRYKSFSKFIDSNVENNKRNSIANHNHNYFDMEDVESVQGEFVEEEPSENFSKISTGFTPSSAIQATHFNIENDSSLASPVDLPTLENRNATHFTLGSKSTNEAPIIENDSGLSSSFEEQEELYRAHEALMKEREQVQQLYDFIYTTLEEIRLGEKHVLIDLNLLQTQLQSNSRELTKYSKELDKAVNERNDITSSFSAIAKERADYERELENLVYDSKNRKLRQKEIETIRRLKYRLKKAEGLETHKNSVIERLKEVEENANSEIQKLQQNRKDIMEKLKHIRIQLKALEDRKEILQSKLRQSLDKCNTLKVKFDAMRAQLHNQPSSEFENLQEIYQLIADFEEDIKKQVKFIPEMEALNEQKKEIEDILELIDAEEIKTHI